MANYRDKGISTLKLVLKQEKNINTLEKALYNKTVSQVEDDDDIEAQYKTNLYQIVCDIQDKEKLKDILENIKKGKIGWEHPSYSEMAYKIAEQNEFIQNPFEVEEGVFQCKQCGSRRVYSYAKQDRASDEGTSVYAQCVACKATWRERG